MVTEQLSKIFNFRDAPVVFYNEAWHFNIRLIKPEGEKYQLLITDGLSDYVQKVDDKNKSYERIELYVLLPDFWDLTKKNWPVEWLNKIAEVPQKSRSWFGAGDTIAAGNPAVEIDEILKCSYFILSKPLFLESKLCGESWAQSGFQMLAVIPVFKKEFEFKSQYSSTTLLKIFQDKKVFEMIDIYRQPVARKKIMGLF